MEGTTLTVILGAGAAVDVVPPNYVSNANYKPPTVLTLFDSPIHINESVDFYGVSNIWEDLQEAVASAKENKSSISIENYLKGLMNSNEEGTRKEFRHFAPYLRRYFTLISTNYCRFPYNYMNLIRHTMGTKFAKTTYITLNYDLLFDTALKRSSLTSNHFDNSENFRKYVSDKWSYFKIHGSVDWVRPISFPEKAALSNLEEYLRCIDSVSDNFDHYLGEYSISTDIQTEKEFLYPALAVPTGGTKFNMPSILENDLKEEVSACENFLIIGYSGIDNDVWELLKNKSKPIKSILFVTNDSYTANKLQAQAKEATKQDGLWPMTYSKGFQSFINDKMELGLEAFIRSIQENVS